MIQTNRQVFELLCQRRNCPVNEAMPCVVAQSGDRWTVDENHSAFPGKSSPGLGDMVAAGLAAVGITPERVSALTGKPCGCKKRQEALNALGRRIGIG